MSDQTSFEVQIYSPRWGHEDRYEVTMDREKMTVSLLRITATCSWIEGRDLKWSGHGEITGNPLEQILQNDQIHPPTIFVSALEYAWMAWRDGRLDNQAVFQEVQVLCEWVNLVSRSQPTTDFWQRIF